MSDISLIVDAFDYADENLYEIAIKEQKAINYLSKQLGNASQKQIQDVYDKLIDDNFFKSENGLTFLYLLRENLINVYKVDESTLKPIPVERANDARVKSVMFDCNERVKAAQKETKNIRDRSRIFIIAIVVLLIALGAMFYILRTSDIPTILDYQTKIEDKYSQWEEDLKQRESIIRKKERALNIENDD
jgi:hypothetical protein